MNSLVPSLAGSSCPVQTLDQLKLLLFLHARPCRSYTADYLARKLGLALTPGQPLDFLVRAKLVARAELPVPSFSYGVEEPGLLVAVDLLSLRSRAASALFGFLAALTRRRSRPLQPTRLGELVAKPRQRLVSLPEHPAEPSKRRRRGPRHSLAVALRAPHG